MKAVQWPIVVNFCVIWALVESFFISNSTTSSFLYICMNKEEIYTLKKKQKEKHQQRNSK